MTDKSEYKVHLATLPPGSIFGHATDADLAEISTRLVGCSKFCVEGTHCTLRNISVKKIKAAFGMFAVPIKLSLKFIAKEAIDKFDFNNNFSKFSQGISIFRLDNNERTK